MPRTPLQRLRRTLTAWYLATFIGILLILGGGIFVVVSRQLEAALDSSLRQAVSHLEEAAAVRERERGLAGQVADAVDELRIPDRRLYLLDARGAPVRPAEAPAWVQELARDAALRGGIARDFTDPTDGEARARGYADTFQLPRGQRMIAIAVADRVEFEDRYSELIALFGAAALVAMLLVAAAGHLLVDKSLRPIEASMEQQRRFMADAAHELRTPLSVLRGRAEVALQHPRDAATYAAALEGITVESGHLGRIVEDIFTLARGQAGHRPVEQQRFFLDDVVLDAADAARVMATAKGVTMELAEFEEAPLVGDPHLVRRLAMILLDNAIKFTAPGGDVTVHVGTDGGRPFLRITDTGVGIAPGQLPHIFERFYRGDQARTRSVEGAGGAGLGLAIAQWIASSHNATLRVTSELGVGTTAEVRFRLPD